MEIVVQKVSFSDSQHRFSNLNFKIPKEKIVSIYGNGSSALLNLLYDGKKSRGTMLYDHEKRTKSNELFIQRELLFLPQKIENIFTQATVEEELRYHLQLRNLPVANIDKKVQDTLKLVGLSGSLRSKPISVLSDSEKKLLQLAIGLLANPKVLLLEDPMVYFDQAHKMYLLKLFKKLKEQYHKTIVLTSKDVNLIYQYTDYVVLLGEDHCLKEGVPTKVFDDIELLVQNGIFELPNLLLFTEFVRATKKVKLSYHRDIRDLIKDVYKHLDFAGKRK